MTTTFPEISLPASSPVCHGQLVTSHSQVGGRAETEQGEMGRWGSFRERTTHLLPKWYWVMHL